MLKNDILSLRETLDLMSTEQLDEMLNKELRAESVDGNCVRLILDILREREKNQPLDFTPEIQNAWEEYQENTKKPDSSRVGKLSIRIASLAALLALVFTIVPKTAGAESFFEKLARWTDEFVAFFSSSDDAHLIENEFITDNSGLQQVYDAVVGLGIYESVIPMWLPDGYDLDELSEKRSPSKSYVYARFSNGNDEIVIQVDVYDVETTHFYLKDESNIHIVEIDGTTFNIMRNLDIWMVVWAKDKIECSISIDCQEETLYKILGSIKSMEESE